MSRTYGYHSQPLHNLFLALHNLFGGGVQVSGRDLPECVGCTTPEQPTKAVMTIMAFTPVVIIIIAVILIIIGITFLRRSLSLWLVD